MPFDGSGSFIRAISTGSWQGDAAANIKIRADRHDTHDGDIANGLSNCITKDGQTQIAANISWNSRKITNLANPTAPQDAATKAYVDTLPGWSAHKDISGAGTEGRLNFTSPTGVNGITWSSISSCWVAKPAKADNAHEPNRVVLNNSLAATDGANDLFGFDVQHGHLMYRTQQVVAVNLISDPFNNWRTPVAGIGGYWASAANQLTAWANTTATGGAYNVPTLENWYTLAYGNGDITQIFNKKASGDIVSLYSRMDGANRWIVQIGDGNAEDGTNAGSDIGFFAYANNGTTQIGQAMHMYRKTAMVTFPVGYTGILNMDNKVSWAAAGVVEAATTMVVAGSPGSGNSVFVRPQGSGVTATQTSWSTTGAMTVNGDVTVNGGITVTGFNDIHAGQGLVTRAGSSGAYSSPVNRGNIWFNSADGKVYVYIDTTPVQVGTICDYRLKQNVAPLASTWDRVKALRPVSYQHRDFEIFRADGVERWGFVAHELQESLLPTAASGTMDGMQDVVETTTDEAGVEQTKVTGTKPFLQSPDLLTIVAALTATLQEAMLRIEALEARP